MRQRAVATLALLRRLRRIPKKSLSCDGHNVFLPQATSVIASRPSYVPLDVGTHDSRVGEEKLRALLLSNGMDDRRILEAMLKVPRSAFVPRKLQSRAYDDCALPIGWGQTITGPLVIARVARLLMLKPTDRLLEIGTGSGYQAAVFSQLAAHVYTIEVVRALARTASKRLANLGYENITTRISDGYLGWPELAPFDKVVLACSPEVVPQPIVDQLSEGGRMILPLGSYHQQRLILLEKRGGHLVRRDLTPTLYVAMTGRADEDRSQQVETKKPQIRNGDFQLLEEDGSASDWHESRQLTLARSVLGGAVVAEFKNEDPGRRADIMQTVAVDGAQFRSVEFTLCASGENIANGPHSEDRAGLQVIFEGWRSRRREAFLAVQCIGSFEVTKFAATVRVPRYASQAHIQVGLCGATGRLNVSAVSLRAHARYRRTRSAADHLNRRMIADNIRKSLKHLRHGQPLKGLRILRLLGKCVPAHPTVQFCLASAAFHAGDLDLAAVALRAALSDPSLTPGTASRAARLLVAVGDRERARASLISASQLFPTSSIVWRTLGAVQGQCSEDAAAVASFQRAIEMATTTDDKIQSLSALAEYFDQNRRKKEANAIYRQILEFAPNNPMCNARLADTRREGESAAGRIDSLNSILSTPCPSMGRRHMHYALGQIYDHEGRAAEAFAHFHLANEIRARSAPGLDLERLTIEVEARIEIFDSAFIDKLREPETQNETMVFVVGMPRSGTTLVEQILGCHSAIRPLGERDDVFRLSRRLRWLLRSKMDYPWCARKLSRAVVHALSKSLRDQRCQEAGPCDRIVTKLPEDFWNLGLIAILFPKAWIIHCSRHPIDTCLSCYMQNFESLIWATSLDQLADVYRLYLRIMEHWRSVVPASQLFELQYEDLISEPEETVRRLCDFARVPFQEGCLRFYETSRRVDTASRWQVRNPLYTTSVGRWKHYRPFLGPLLELDCGLPRGCGDEPEPAGKDGPIPKTHERVLNQRNEVQ